MLRDVMSTYSDVKAITEKLWSRAYRYPVSNGIRIVEIGLQPIYLPMIVGNRVLISYEGQPLHCYGYNEPEHQFHECPQRQKVDALPKTCTTNTWANVVVQGIVKTLVEGGGGGTGTGCREGQYEVPASRTTRLLLGKCSNRIRVSW
jgi:hypothetical protein